MSVQKVLLCPFHCKPRPSGLSLESPGLKNIAQVPGNPFEVRQNYDIRKAVSATLSVLKSGYISLQKLESERSKSFPVCISLQTKAIKS